MTQKVIIEGDTRQLEDSLDRVSTKAGKAKESIQNVQTPNSGRADMGWLSSSMFESVAPMDQNGELVQKVNNSYDQMDKELKNVIDSFRRFREILKNSETMPAPNSGHAPVDPNPDNAPGTTAKDKEQNGKNINVAGGVIGASQGISDAARSIAAGDPWSAGLGGLSKLGQGAMKMGTAADGTMSILGMLGTAGVVTALLGAGANALAGQYENALPGIDALLTAYGGAGVNGAGALVNAGTGLVLRSTAANMSKGTGLDTDTFISYMSNLANYGVTDINRAGSLTNAAAGWSRFTGADMGQVLGFMGFAERYGADGREATMSAFNAARASGLEKGQFSEFLSGVQRVMEDGISKGFIKSSKEVAYSLTNLSLLGGGNKVFQGEAGARMYMNMASGMAGNTALGSTANILMYRTMSDMLGENDTNAKNLLGEGNYLAGGSIFNELALMEKGDVGNLDFLRKLRSNVEGAYGGDRDQIIATYKEQFGLNNQGAIQFYNALTNANLSDVAVSAKLKEIQEDPTMKSDATRLQDTLTELNKAIVEMGKPVFDVKLAGLEALESGVDKIYDFLVGDSYKTLINSIAEEFYDPHTEGAEKSAFKRGLKERLHSDIPAERSATIAEIERLANLTEGQKAAVNLFDLDPANLPANLGESTYNSVRDAKANRGKYSLVELLGELEWDSQQTSGNAKWYDWERNRLMETGTLDALQSGLKQMTLYGATKEDYEGILGNFRSGRVIGPNDFAEALQETNKKLEQLIEATQANGDAMSRLEVEVGG